MSASMWLSKKKKADLQVMAKELGLDYNNKLKNELESDLTEHLANHQKDLQHSQTFAPYYDTLVESPTKANTTIIRNRRASRHFSKSTATDEESPEREPAPQSPATTRKKTARTPRTSVLRAANVPLPMSPGDLADAMNTRTLQRFTDAVADTSKTIVEKTGAREKIAYTRETLSNVNTLSALAIMYEFALLMKDLIPIDYYQLDVPVPAIGDSSVIVNIPNLFVILSYNVFWRPLLFWAVNALVLPLTAAYFVNLRHTSQYDPLSYSVARGLVNYFIYDKQILKYSKIGLFSDDTGPLVNSIIGTEAPYICAAITGLAAVWDAIINNRA